MWLVTGLFLLASRNLLVSANRRQWYYTGKLLGSDIADVNFEGAASSIWRDTDRNSTADRSDTSMLSLVYGGMLQNFSHYNSSIDDHISAYLDLLLGMRDRVSIRGAWTHSLYMSKDYKRPLQFEIGLYDHDLKKFVEHANNAAKAGSTVVISADEFIADASMCRSHLVVVSVDLRRDVSPLQHLWRDSDRNISAADCISQTAAFVESLKSKDRAPTKEQATSAPTSAIDIRVMTYNLWHTNPAAWLYHDSMARWIRYWKRIHFFVNNILNDDPDVILLQEVRFDAAFSGSRIKGFIESSTNRLDTYEKQCVLSGSQIEQIRCMLELLSARRRQEGNASAAPAPNADDAAIRNSVRDRCLVETDGSMECEDDASFVIPPAPELEIRNSYQFVFHPAMSMANSQYPWVRGEEEGVAVIVKSTTHGGLSQHVSAIDVFLLPRMLNDSGDDHQRALLHVEIEVAAAIAELPRKLVYDVYTTHLSLSESARNRSYEKIKLQMNTGRGAMQFFGGDLNAEPHEGGILELSDALTWSNDTPLHDLWRTQEQNDITDENINDLALAAGYTFPTCKPSKRIDYLFFRSRLCASSLRSCVHQVVSTNTYLAGREASSDTAHLVDSRPDIGMMDLDSPLWASDHMALTAKVSVAI